MSLDLGDEIFYVSVDKEPELSRNFLVERHLISRHHAMATGPRGAVIARHECFTAMLNEEDHLRMQALCPGLRLREAWQAVDAVDSELDRYMHLAAMNRGILMTPFHNMALIAPDTTSADIEYHTRVFKEGW